MFKYVKHLSYPVSVTKKDLKMAKLIITQVGGYAGELGASAIASGTFNNLASVFTR